VQIEKEKEITGDSEETMANRALRQMEQIAGQNHIYLISERRPNAVFLSRNKN